jgi:hypothetical protein
MRFIYQVIVAAIIIVGVVLAIALPYYWASWVWTWDWGIFLRHRRWIFCFLALFMGTPTVFIVIAASAAMLAGRVIDDMPSTRDY